MPLGYDRIPAEAGQSQPLRNWAGNYRYSTDRITSATSLARIQEFVREHAHFKVLGTRHCFNGIADSADRFLSLREMKEVVALDREARTVTVETHSRNNNWADSATDEPTPALGLRLLRERKFGRAAVAIRCATGTLEGVVESPRS